MADDDKVIARLVRERTTDLNEALSKAAEAGIEVDIDQIDVRTMGSPVIKLRLVARCRRVTEV